MRRVFGLLADAVHYCLVRPLATDALDWKVRKAQWSRGWPDPNRNGVV